MTLYDLFIVAVVAISTGFGWLRGALREVVTLLAIAGGTGLIVLFSGSLSGLTRDSVVASVVMLLVLFTLGFLIVTLSLELIVRRLAGPTPQTADRLLGGALGAVRGWFLIGLVTLGITYYYDDNALPSFLEDAAFEGVAMHAADALQSIGVDGRERPTESDDDLAPL